MAPGLKKYLRTGAVEASLIQLHRQPDSKFNVNAAVISPAPLTLSILFLIPSHTGWTGREGAHLHRCF